MAISIDTVTAFDKGQHIFIIRILKKLKGSYLSAIKATYEDTKAQTIIKRDNRKFPL